MVDMYLDRRRKFTGDIGWFDGRGRAERGGGRRMEADEWSNESEKPLRK